MRTKRPIGSRQTVRLRKLECSDLCGYIVRVSAKWATVGLPSCPCGGTLWPAELEDAVALLPADVLETHPAYQEFIAEASSIAHGQAWKAQGHGTTALPRTAEAGVQAAARVRARERQTAHATKLGALRAALTIADPIPF